MVEIDLVFAEQLRTARRNAGLSLAEASDGICSISYLSLIESGKRNANPRMARELAARMEIKLPAPLITAGVHPLADRAELAYRAGGLKAAKKFIDRMDNAPEALLILGLDAEGTRNLEKAADYLKRAFEAPFVSPVTKMSVALARCRVLREMGHLQHAISVGEHALEEWRGYSDELTEVVVGLRGTIAGCYIETGDFHQAAELSDLELNKLPSPRAKAMNLWAKADLANEEGDFIEAELITREALVWARLADHPRMTASLLENRVFNELKTDKPNLEQILTDLDTAESLHDQYGGNKTFTLKARAVALAKKGDKEGALEQLELARVATDPKYSVDYSRFSFAAIEVYGLLGLKNDEQREVEACIKAVEKSGANRTAAVMYRNLAEIFLKSGEKDRALECLLRATEMFGLDTQLINHTAPSVIGTAK
ncbi:MAG: helix-turn-helix transcriptional regulator [Rhodoluna sp.]|nr:helix-turn-helix transcriptional regulator [Rhodoluna sp.]